MNRPASITINRDGTRVNTKMAPVPAPARQRMQREVREAESVREELERLREREAEVERLYQQYLEARRAFVRHEARAE